MYVHPTNVPRVVETFRRRVCIPRVNYDEYFLFYIFEGSMVSRIVDADLKSYAKTILKLCTVLERKISVRSK